MSELWGYWERTGLTGVPVKPKSMDKHPTHQQTQAITSTDDPVVRAVRSPAPRPLQNHAPTIYGVVAINS